MKHLQEVEEYVKRNYSNQLKLMINLNDRMTALEVSIRNLEKYVKRIEEYNIDSIEMKYNRLEKRIEGIAEDYVSRESINNSLEEIRRDPKRDYPNF